MYFPLRAIRREAVADGPWFLRQERCYLVPGDSPLGFRLPLDSLPWAARETIPTSTRLIQHSFRPWRPMPDPPAVA